METVKNAKKTYSELGWCYIAGTVLVQVFQICYVLVVRRLAPGLEGNMNVMMLASCITVYGLALPLIFLLAKRLPTTTLEKHPMKWWQFILAFFMSYSLVYVSNLVGTGITTIVGQLKGSPVQNNLLEVVTGGNMFLNFVYMVILAPIMEELIFRKVLVDRVVCYGQGLAIFISGLMFGLFHGNLNQFAYAFGLGAFFAFLYIKTGNIKITMGLHAIINFLGSVVAANLMKAINYTELMKLDQTDTQAVMDFVMNNLGAWILFGAYGMLLLICILTGIIMWIVSLCCKKFVLAPVECQVPKGERFRTLVMNPGMIVFMLIWVALIILQLFS